MDHAANDGQAQDVSSAAKPTTLSCADIASRLGRNPVSVFRAIKRLRLVPETETPGGYKFYSEAAVELVKAAMRAPNHKKDIPTPA